MPELVRLYIRNVFAGFALSVVFVGLLLWFNVANLWHLISASDVGYIALGLLVVFNTVVFSGVQFGIAVMRLAEPEDGGQGGRRDAIPVLEPARVPVAAKAIRKR
ncbi:hypothetical protein [Phaeovulum sp. NW3]|uniref:hypothetical protein n=1 Tax=Phaeovulum sp. NW3 TaxID=2934933 RepID=UPI0020202BDE|nr:hypothetical protein [Phaeovulum sp. NW3]MCL7466207.1 hypothetical protein [Phaeovulum sp. NW3]